MGHIEALGRALDPDFIEEWYRRNLAPGTNQCPPSAQTSDAPELSRKLQLAFAVEVLSCTSLRCQSALADQLVSADWRRPMCRATSVATVVAGLTAVVALAIGGTTLATVAAVATLSGAILVLFLECWLAATQGSRAAQDMAARLPSLLKELAAAEGQLKTFVDHIESEAGLRAALASANTLCQDILVNAKVLLKSEPRDDREIVAPLQA